MFVVLSSKADNLNFNIMLPFNRLLKCGSFDQNKLKLFQSKVTFLSVFEQKTLWELSGSCPSQKEVDNYYSCQSMANLKFMNTAHSYSGVGLSGRGN